MDNTKLNSLIVNAEKHYRIADHMTYVSYSILKDAKLLMNVVENLNSSMKNAVEAILHYERINKRISFYPREYENMIDVLKTVSRNYNLKESDINFLKDINRTVNEHKKSPVEFTRRNKFIIASDIYRLKTLTIEDAKSYISKAKVFILILHKLINS